MYVYQTFQMLRQLNLSDAMLTKHAIILKYVESIANRYMPTKS